jgi:WD40 repeat protein
VRISILLYCFVVAPASPAQVSQGLPKLDLHGDPLPPGATVRLGTIAYRHRFEMPSLAFRPGGKIVAVPDGNHINAWELTTGKITQVFRLKPPTNGSEWQFRNIAYSPDGAYFVASSGLRPTHPAEPFEPSRIFVWDARSGRFQRALDRSRVNDFCFCMDDRTIAVAEEKRITFWDVATGKKSRDPSPIFEKFPVTIAYASGSRQLVAGFQNGEVRLWKLPEFEPISSSNQATQVRSVVVSADGKLIVESGPKLVLWNGDEPRTLGEFDDVPWLNAVAFSPDSSLLASSHGGDDIVLWEMPNGKRGRVLHGGRGPVQFSPDGKILACADAWDNVLRFWNARTGERMFQADGPEGTIDAIAFSPTGDRVGTCGNDKSVRIWDVDRGKELHRYDDTGSVRGAAWSPDGTMFAAGSRVFDARSGKLLRRFSESRNIEDVAFSRDGKFILTDSHLLQWWDVKSGRQLGRLASSQPNSQTIVSPDGKRAVLSGAGDSVVVWDLVADRRLQSIPRASWGMLAISPDGTRIINAGGSVAISDIADPTKARLLDKSLSDVYCAAFAPHGRFLALSRRNETVELWDVELQRKIVSIGMDQGTVTSLAFSADGRWLATGGVNSTVLLWPLNEIFDGGDGGTDIQSLWEELGRNDDLRRTYRALVRLSSAADKAMPLFRKQLKPHTPVTAERLSRLIADLEAEDFPKREGATRELVALGDAAEFELKRTRKGTDSPEAIRRIDHILKRLEHRTPEAERQLLAVLALEAIGTADAVRLLDELSRGAPGARLTRDARAALDRLDERRKATSR